MEQRGLANFFEKYLEKRPLFSEKSVLQSSYTPDVVAHRDKEIKQIANVLAPALRMERPSNLFLYGKTGTGKTLCVRYTAKQIDDVCKARNLEVYPIYINCKLSKIADTEYRLIAQLSREFGKQIPPTGLPTEEVYKAFYSSIDNSKKIVILILDEIDQLVKKAGDEIIYSLTRINSELKMSQISIVGISNDLMFTDTLDPRVKSSLSEEELVFAPYNAIQLQSILKARSKKAFRDGVLDDGVVEKCAAYAAREHGDARRALELLRVAAELAERNNEEKVLMKHIDLAEEKIEKDRITEIINTQPKQQQIALYSIIAADSRTKESIYTGDVYEIYKKLCPDVGLRPLTQRRISDIIAELDMLGIINAKVISKGRFGRTREISMAISPCMKVKIKSLLESGLGL